LKGQKMLSLNDPLKHDVVELLRELLHALLMSSVPAWIDLQLTVPQLRTVFIIAHGQSSSVTQIAQHLGIGEPTASHLIERLVQAGLVERTEDPDDRRRARVRLAPAGEGIIEKLLGWEDLLGGWLYKLPKDDLSHLRQGLQALVDELHAQASTDRRGSQNED
jgi:MarR family transcriptional regulator, organic hydroperoxide resistance regulator